MKDDKTPHNHEGDEEELNITDDDIDRELAGLDAEQDVSDVEAELSEDDFAAATQKKKGLLGKLRSMSRGRLILLILIIIALLYVVIKAMFSGKNNNFSNIQPAANSTAPAVVSGNEKALASIKSSAGNKSGSSVAASSKSSSLSESKQISGDFENKTVTQPKSSITVPASLTKAEQQQVSSGSNNSASNHNASKSAEKSADGMSAQVVTSTGQASNNQAALIAEIKSLQNNNQQLAQKLSEVSSQLSQLGQKVGSLHGEVGHLGQQVTEIGQHSTQAQADNANRAGQANDGLVHGSNGSYYVEAVVPGRAWLEGPDGDTITVAVGDSLPNLGVISKIDPYTGDVTTSSGEVIKYGPN